jgi:hypothetical protein
VILKALVMVSSIFCHREPHNPLKANRRFGGIHRLDFRGKRISQAKSYREGGSKRSFLLALFFNTEDRENVILRNVK